MEGNTKKGEHRELKVSGEKSTEKIEYVEGDYVEGEYEKGRIREPWNGGEYGDI